MNARTSKDETALHVAAASGSLATARILLKAGADINAVDNKVGTSFKSSF